MQAALAHRLHMRSGEALPAGARSERVIGARMLPSARACSRGWHSSALASSGALAPGDTTVADSGRSNVPSVVKPSGVYVKVGAAGTGSYVRLPQGANAAWLQRADNVELFKTLNASVTFRSDVKGMTLRACRILVLDAKQLQADGVTEPDAAHETGDSIELSGIKTLGVAATEVGVDGSPLFVRVGECRAASGLQVSDVTV